MMDLSDAGRTSMTLHEGDIYWLLPDPAEPDAGILHPHVVIQADAVTASGEPAVLACALTTNLKRVSLPGNVLLDLGEANLPKASVVEVSKDILLPTRRLGAFIGTVSAQRLAQIRAGIRFVQTSFSGSQSD
jgi:mRNA interferase MazF